MQKKLILAFSLILLVGATAMVIYGVMTNDEAGLKTPRASWPKGRIPLRVQARAYTINIEAGEEADRAVRYAISTINVRLDFEVFRIIDSGPHDIRVTVGVPQTTSPMRETKGAYLASGLREAGGLYELRGVKPYWVTCNVETSNTGTEAILAFTLEHELGHCLGLAHDDFEASIMRAVQSDWKGGFPPRITDHDRDLLRTLYMK